MSKDEKPTRTPTSDDVALLAGVSRSAVSRTFTAGASVAPTTREKVIEAARTLGYRVNFLARGLSQQRTNLVGLVVPDMENAFPARLMDYLARGLVELNYRPLILPATAGEDVSNLIDVMLHYTVSGAIVISDSSPEEIAQECAAYGVPLVLVNKPEVGDHVANVSFNAEKAGRLAARALSDAGCQRIGIASQRRPSHSIGIRKHAFVSACGELGLEIVADFKGAVQDYAGGVQAAKAFEASGLCLDGVHCVNDYLALGFVDHLRIAMGISVPGDLKIVACDDITEAAWLGYDLTTVRQDPKAIANAAIAALIKRIDHPDVPVPHMIIDVTLIERSSTGASEFPTRK